MVWPLEAKKSRKLWRISLLFMMLSGCHALTSDNKRLYPLKFRPYRRLGDCGMDDEAVITATRQWIEKAVIGLNLCPFAKAVYVKNQVRYVVSRAPHLDGFLEDLDRELDFLATANPDEVDTTLLVHPTLLPDFLDFNDFLQLAEAAVGEHGLDGVIQIASFHPRFQFEDTAPDDMGNFTNRAPFPTLHLLREASIAAGGGGVSRSRDHLRAQYRNAASAGACGMAGLVAQQAVMEW